MPHVRVLITLLCAVCVAGSCTKDRAPNVILILVDTLRADRLGAYGNQRVLTPFLDELATHGTVFLNAYSTSSYTVPAVATLFTSRYTSQHRVINSTSSLQDSEVTLAERLSEAGFAAAAFSANIQINAEYGYQQGFQNFFTMKLRKLRAYTIRERVRKWLDTSTSRATPAFLYLHYFEPHYPYEPPEPFRGRFRFQTTAPINEQQALRNAGPGNWHLLSPDDVALLASLYDAEIASLDEQLRLQFNELRERGVLDNAIVVITADHGEEFRDHGEMGHGRSLYGEQIRIPLIVTGPGIAAQRVSENVSLVDVAPTLLELIGQPAPRAFEGRSLASLLRGNSIVGWFNSIGTFFGVQRQSPILFELERMNGKYDTRRHTVGLIDGNAKLLQGRDGETLYDLRTDWGEQAPLASGGEVSVDALRERLTAMRADLQRRAAPEAEQKPLDPATKEKLRALGYDPD